MNTNRNYFSWSQYYLWQKSKKQFYKHYGLNEKSKSNKQFAKGKEFAHFKETGEILPSVKNPDMLEIVADAVDELEIMEHEVNVTIDKYDLLAFIDSGMADYSEFFEYKTGKIPWTNEKVEDHEQLDFYALCYYIASGQKTIPSCKLIWIETQEEEDGLLTFTGNVETFSRNFTKDDMVKMMAKIITVKKEIDEWEYTELELDDKKVDRYIQLKKILEDAKEESELIRLEIMTIMQEQNVKYASTNRASFSISERKTKIYPKNINQTEKKYKNEIKELKRQAEKRGEAKIRVSESLRFTLKK
mgnify:CR=1 FL=1